VSYLLVNSVCSAFGNYSIHFLEIVLRYDSVSAKPNIFVRVSGLANIRIHEACLQMRGRWEVLCLINATPWRYLCNKSNDNCLYPLSVSFWNHKRMRLDTGGKTCAFLEGSLRSHFQAHPTSHKIVILPFSWMCTVQNTERSTQLHLMPRLKEWNFSPILTNICIALFLNTEISFVFVLSNNSPLRQTYIYSECVCLYVLIHILCFRNILVSACKPRQ
jgi:hypothetical protein